jgi:pSer/pThr/pTyr-binding forkhead associated (FHA) protein
MEDSSSRWTVRDVGSKNGTWLDEVPLSPGEPRLLSNGARILAAHVCLTFYEPIGLLGRLGTSPSTAPPRSQAPSAK